MFRITISLLVAITLSLLAHAPTWSEAFPKSHLVHNEPVDEDGAVRWEALANMDIRVATPAPLKTIFHREFRTEIKALGGKIVRLKGFMYPLRPGETHTSFLLSALPPSCPFSLPGSSTTLIDIIVEEPVRYIIEPVMLEGRLNLLKNDDSGLHYRLTEARQVE
tara:strand:+ start:94 stop:585 length:492 start_codon:yes stop_codon:yes gene_type:complete